MKNPYTQPEMLNQVKQLLANVLGLTPEEIAENQAIVDDLNADSLDFVDLNATLEKRFNLSLPKKSVLEQAEKMSGALERFCGKHGLTEDGIGLLEHSLSKYSQLSIGMTTHDIFNATTVANVAHLCHGLFDHLPGACPECGHAVAVISPAGKVVCAGCSAAVRPLHGNEVQDRCIAAYLAQKNFATV